MHRTHTCGELGIAHVGQPATVAGWVHRRRDHGGVVFFDLRDRYGLVQVTVNPDLGTQVFEMLASVRFEWVLKIAGTVQKRPQGMENPRMATGAIEVIATDLEVISPAKPMPFMVSGEEQEAERVGGLDPRLPLGGADGHLAVVDVAGEECQHTAESGDEGGGRNS